MPTETEKAYLAGLLDGEGHIGITLANPRGNNGEWRTHTVIVTLANTHLETLKWAVTICPRGTLVVRRQPKQTIPIGNVRWSSAAAGEMLTTVQPYLRIKVAQAALALQFVSEMRQRAYHSKVLSQAEWEQREALRLAIRQINRPDPTLATVPYPTWRYERVCLTCGNVFLPTDGSRRLYCTPHCFRAMQWQRQKAKRIQTIT